MIIGLIIILCVIGCILLIIGENNLKIEIIGLLMGLLSLIILIFGCFNGFINYPATEGTHQEIITSVDLEGVYFRRYEVYLKSSSYTNQSIDCNRTIEITRLDGELDDTLYDLIQAGLVEKVEN